MDQRGRLSAFKKHQLALAVTALFATMAHAHNGVIHTAEAGQPEQSQSAKQDDATTLNEVKVTDQPTTQAPSPSERTRSYTTRRSNASTRLDLSVRETPQSISVVTREQMDDFGLNNVNDVLDNTTGIVVERVETDRTYYTSRGFDITNFQVDGIGIPAAFGNVQGDMDTAIYDRIETIRGANGLMVGTGNPSATVNFIRKRPTTVFQASGGLTYGSWNDRRVDLDVSGPLTTEGNLRGRLVFAGEDKDSYLDRYEHNKTVFHGVLEGDLGNATTLTAGYTRQRNKVKGAMWGALPLYYTDGSATDYDTSTNTAADWSFWTTTTQTGFAELRHRFDNDWEAKAVYTQTQRDETSDLFYTYGTPDRSTGLGLFSWPSAYRHDNTQKALDLQAKGPFSLGGRKHELVGGITWSETRHDQTSYNTNDIGLPLPDLASWSGEFPHPIYDAPSTGGVFTDRFTSLYGAAKFSVTDALKVITGASATAAKSSGYAYGEDKTRSESAVTPYIGSVLDLTENVSAYASYTGIFNPQYQFDAQRHTLSPAKGNSYELGLKSELFDRKMNATLAVFKTEQKNLASSAGTLIDGTTYYQGIDTDSEGIEADIAGRITSRWQASAGYTVVSIKDKDGKDTRTFTPRQMLHISSTYRLPWLERMKVGATVKWRDKTWRDQGNGVVSRQSAYTLLDLMAQYDVTDNFSVNLKLHNVTNKKYLTSLYWDQAYYGAPFNASLALNWKF